MALKSHLPKREIMVPLVIIDWGTKPIFPGSGNGHPEKRWLRLPPFRTVRLFD